MLADLGLKHPDAAKMLRVSLRTLQNWLSGQHQVPYSVYKLLRLMRYMELPGQAWAGWHFSRGHLITPEGRAISGNDGAWWSLLVRQAHSFGALYREKQLDQLARIQEQQRHAMEAASTVGADAIRSDYQAAPGAVGGEAAGLVTVSTSQTRSDAPLYKSTTYGNQAVISPAAFRYHFEHEKTSCQRPKTPIRSDSLNTLTLPPVSAASPSESASTPLLPLRWMTTSERQAASGPLYLAPENSQSSRHSPSHLSPETRPSTTQTPTTGATSTTPSNGRSWTTTGIQGLKSPIRTTATAPSGKRTLQRSSASTGKRTNALLLDLANGQGGAS